MKEIESLRQWLKSKIVETFLSYSQVRLQSRLRRYGLGSGDTVMVHASWLSLNGFLGKPVEFIDALKQLVGDSGTISMPSMPYQNESTREYLSRNRPLKLHRTPSKMGILSEVFRRGKGVERSVNPAHPILAWGQHKDWLLEGHDAIDMSFGKGSPFDKLLQLDGKILCVDAPFSTITFTHFLEDRTSNQLPFDIYEPEMMSGLVIDADGNEQRIETKVLNPRSARLRREDRFVAALDREKAIKRFKLGNTRFILVSCRDMVSCIDSMAARGEFLFDAD